MLTQLQPLHYIAHCLPIQTFLAAFMSVYLSMPEGDDAGTLKITRHADVSMATAFEATLEALWDLI